MINVLYKKFKIYLSQIKTKKKKMARTRHSQTYNKHTDILTIISQNKREKKGFLAFHPSSQVHKNLIPTYVKQ